MKHHSTANNACFSPFIRDLKLSDNMQLTAVLQFHFNHDFFNLKSFYLNSFDGYFCTCPEIHLHVTLAPGTLLSYAM